MTTRFRMGAPTRYSNCPEAGDFARWLCLMQHFGLPTRLLDWTESPLVAAFFSVTYEPQSGPAAIWCLSPVDLNQIMVGASMLTVLPSGKGNELLRPAFIRSDSPDKAIAVVGQDADLRMTIQQGGFTIHGSPTPLESHPNAERFLHKLLIPEEDRETIRGELWLLGVRGAMLFPDISNLAQELAGEWFYQRKLRRS